MNHSSTATIHLLPQEELGALLARIKDNHAETIRLVIPDKSIVAQGVIGLQVLADEGRRMGKKLVVTSDSGQILRLSRRVGLEVTGSEEGVPEHGFMAGADVAALGMTDVGRDESSESRVPSPESSSVVVDDERPASSVQRPVSSSTNTPHSSAGWKSRLSGKNAKWILAGVVALLLVAFGGMWAFAYYIPTATVTVYAEKQLLDRDLNVTVDPQATEADASSLTVPGNQIEATASKSQTFEATGKKDVGTKASGTVTIYNKTNQDKRFVAGTIVATDGLQFLTSKTITVEAATTTTGIDPDTLEMTTKTTPGSADVSVVAADIGSKYNVEVKSTFAIGKFDDSSYSGRNDEEFSGGTKKEVSVVTEEDQNQALESLESDVEEEATKALQAKVTSGRQLLDEATKLEVTTKEFSQAVGAEASEFSLTLEVTATSMSINPQDIQSMLDKEIEGKVPDGYTLDTEHSKVNNRVISTDDDGVVHITSTYTAQVIPDVDTDAMRKQIAGKNPSVVQEYLKSQPNLHGYDITLSPKLPGPFYHLPSIESRITVKVEVK